MISIFNHRYRSEGKAREESGPDLSEAAFQFLGGLLENINRSVLAGDAFAELRTNIELVGERILQAKTADEFSEARSTVAGILAKYRVDALQAAAAQTLEVQNILAMLNHALIVMAEGRDRSVLRLVQVQNTLQHTSRLGDIVEMKAALADTVEFVKKEAAESRKLVTDELARLQTDLGKARENIGKKGTELPDRADAVASLAEAVRNVPAGSGLFIVAYVCPRLPAITQRYGAQVTEEMVFRVIRERLQPVAGTGTVYRWTPSGQVAVFERQCELKVVAEEVTNLNRAPVVHKMAVGHRTAVLTIAPASLVLEAGVRPHDKLIDDVDQFIAAQS
jgi:hypothetical protein